MTESAVHLRHQVKAFVAEAEVHSQIIFRHGLSGDITVATIIGIQTLFSIDRLIQVVDIAAFDSVSILIQSRSQAQATRNVEHSDRLAYHLINHTVVSYETGTTHTGQIHILFRLQLLSHIRTAQGVQFILLVREIHAHVEIEILCLHDTTAYSQFHAGVGHLSQVRQ